MKRRLVVPIVLLSITLCFVNSFLAPTSGGKATPKYELADIDTVIESSFYHQISNTSDEVRVVASFYPIYEFVKRVGGDRVEVSSLIPVGIEPHDYEPTIQQIQNAQTADMLVITGAGFEEKGL